MKITLQKIAKKYEGNKEFTLNDINLDIDSQDFCVILGPSGCGKSTLVRMIAGLNSITKGDLLFGEKRVNELSPKERDIAMVFQSYALYPHMNVFKNMAFGLTLRGEKKSVIKRRVEDAAEILNISEYLYKKPSDLSGGQRQRVALGRAIVRKPQIFLMDEPLSNLDAKLREKMRTELVKIHRMLNTTSLYVTHDQLEAMTMATKIVLMNNKRIVQVGTPDEIYHKSNSVFAAKFIGSPSMNLIKAQYHKGKITFNTPSLKDVSLETVAGDRDEAQFLDKYNAKDIYLGIRPNRIKILTSPSKSSVKTHLEFSEMLGKEKQLIFAVNKDVELVVSVGSHEQYEIGKTYYLDFDMSHAHYFDLHTEQRYCETYPQLKSAWEKHQKFLRSQESVEKVKKKMFFSLRRKSKPNPQNLSYSKDLEVENEDPRKESAATSKKDKKELNEK